MEVNVTKDLSTVLDNLPQFENMMGIDLKSAAYMIAALSAVHIIFYGCTFFMNLSYLLITIWLLVILYSALSVGLLFGVYYHDYLVLTIWVWYALIFVALMFLMMFLMAILMCTRMKYERLVFVLLGVLWYLLTIYFIFIVNSYRILTKPTNVTIYVPPLAEHPIPIDETTYTTTTTTTKETTTTTTTENFHVIPPDNRLLRAGDTTTTTTTTAPFEIQPIQPNMEQLFEPDESIPFQSQLHY